MKVRVNIFEKLRVLQICTNVRKGGKLQFSSLVRAFGGFEIWLNVS